MKKLGFVLSLIFSFLLVVFLVFSLAVFNVCSFSSKKEIEKNLLNTDLKLVIGKIRNSGSTKRETKFSLLIDDLYYVSNEYGVSEDTLNDILDSKITKKILSKPLGNLTDYVINGNDSKILSSDDLYDLISSNTDEFFREVDINLSDGQKEKFLNRIKMELPYLVGAMPSTKELLNSKYSDKVKIIQFIFGKTIKAILICGIIVFSILIIILRRGRSLLNFGVCYLISAFITLGISFFIPDLILKHVKISEVSMFISSFSSSLCMWLVINSLFLIFISVIFLIIYRIINRRIYSELCVI